VSGFEVESRWAEMQIKVQVVVITEQDTPKARECAIVAAAAYLLKPLG